jgi:hypothetical protein
MESPDVTMAKELLRMYLMFGEDPFIVPTKDGEPNFSARDYARCGAMSYFLTDEPSLLVCSAGNQQQGSRTRPSDGTGAYHSVGSGLCI